MSEFYFAWVDPDETTFSPSAHERFDENVFRLEIEHNEGDLPTATVDIRNPSVGFLSAGRKQWAWIAWQDDGTAGSEPLFFGRLVAIPQDIHEQIVRISFVARPRDVDARRRDVADGLKVRPYWDPVWIAPELRDDPDAVLEARSSLWHYDRVSHDVTISDIITGEEGITDLAGDFFHDSLSIDHRQVPGRRVRVEAEAFWEQRATGTVDATASLLAAAKAASSGNGQNIDTFTGGGLALDWPEEGDDIGGGWRVGESFVLRGNGLWVPVEFETVIQDDGEVTDFPSWSFRPRMKVVYDAARSRTERITFTLEADVQALVTDPGDEEEIRLSLSSRELNEPIDQDVSTAETPEPTAPIGDARRRSYFQTDRGHQSVEYLIALARATLLARSRAVEISFETRWRNGLDLNCRKNIRIADPRIPGGEATGKVVGYRLLADGDAGELACQITMLCAVGQGNTVAAVTGTPDYVAEGYVEPGYQTYTGSFLMPIAGEVTYQDFDNQAISDDGVDFFNMTPGNIITEIEIINGAAIQRAVLRAFKADYNEAVTALNQVFTEIYLELVPLNTGPFENEFAITVSGLMVPKTIDLEAA